MLSHDGGEVRGVDGSWIDGFETRGVCEPGFLVGSLSF